jgi:hypothetical protein
LACLSAGRQLQTRRTVTKTIGDIALLAVISFVAAILAGVL